MNDPLIGQMLGQYRIEARIGQGGMAVVYRAYQPSLGRTVAIKVLPALLATDPTFVARFRREASLAARLDHPNILTMYDFGEQNSVTYIAMAYIAGGTLQDLLTGPLDPEDVVPMAVQVAGALGYAHAAGVIHRDVKPSNVLLGEQGRVFLSDFGIARITDAETRLTSTGSYMGTPEYMSPEQAEGRHDIDGRSDLYSLGVVLYRMFTGVVPFEGSNIFSVIHKHLYEPVPPPTDRAPDLPEPFVAVVNKALAKKREERYQTAEELQAALEQALEESRAKGLLTRRHAIIPIAEPPAGEPSGPGKPVAPEQPEAASNAPAHAADPTPTPPAARRAGAVPVSLVKPATPDAAPTAFTPPPGSQPPAEATAIAPDAHAPTITPSIPPSAVPPLEMGAEAAGASSRRLQRRASIVAGLVALLLCLLIGVGGGLVALGGGGPLAALFVVTAPTTTPTRPAASPTAPAASPTTAAASPTVEAATATSVPPTETAAPEATATSAPAPTATQVAAVPTATARPANTPTTPPAAPTATSAPPTATPEPPTATPEPPTATPAPPTATPRPAGPVSFGEVGATVGGMRFFEGSCSAGSPAGSYATTFAKTTTRCVQTELVAQFPESARGSTVTYNWVITGPGVRQTPAGSRQITASGPLQQAIISWVGSSTPGQLPAGSWRVDFVSGGQTLASGTFEVN